jgi:hypothetical protein
MQTRTFPGLLLVSILLIGTGTTIAQTSQQDTTQNKWRKNVVRYNLSSALLFGFDRCVILGYERVINHHQSASINFGVIALPKLIQIITDSFSLNKDRNNSGYNVSADYRFYLAKENRYLPPHGLYIGPFYSFNHFHRENEWSFQHSSNNPVTVHTKTDLNINTVGGELGYQFILWKRFSIDLVMIGPGLGFYNLKAEIDNTLSEANREQLQQAITQAITQKFPGFNYVFSGKTLNGNGRLTTRTIGYRYLMHIGFAF